jgi:ketosteroid isomerase-like protein
MPQVLEGRNMNPHSLTRDDLADPDLRRPIEQMQAYLEAHNRHDIEAAMSFYTQDARFELVGEWVKVGKETIRDELEEWDAATNNHLTFYDFQIGPEQVVFRAIEQSDHAVNKYNNNFHFNYKPGKTGARSAHWEKGMAETENGSTTIDLAPL